LVKDLILERRKAGVSIIFSTHLMDYAEKIVDDIVMINDGRKLLEGPLNKIKTEHSERILSISYRGDLTFLRELEFVREIRDYGNRAEIEISGIHHKQDILNRLLKRVSLDSFKISDSSLNHIFISALSGAEKGAEQ
jgi:ABC-2 type transport system ATP-binding protein